MAKSRKLESTLARLEAIRANLTSETAIAALRQGLQSPYGVAVAKAAKLVRLGELYDLTPDLVKAFDRLMESPVATDPGCGGKFQIADTLYRLECSNESIFLRGIRHRQLEPVWGGQEDTALQLRCVCALGLVKMNYPQVFVELADLLADPYSVVRAGAAQALAYTGHPQGAIPLLRLRVKAGDADPRVISECLLGLLGLAPEESLPLVLDCLHSPREEIVEMAALALGEAKPPGAFEHLQTWWRQVLSLDLKRTGLLAMAMLRQDAPLDFLLELVAIGHRQDAQAALDALELYRQDERLWQRVEAALAQRPDDPRLEG
ncbi:MAG: HEAT repeat domain-containing protein [Nodosilinea sp.]